MTVEDLHYKLCQKVEVLYHDGEKIKFYVNHPVISHWVVIDFDTKEITATASKPNMTIKAKFDPDTCYIKGHELFSSNQPNATTFSLK